MPEVVEVVRSDGTRGNDNQAKTEDDVEGEFLSFGDVEVSQHQTGQQNGICVADHAQDSRYEIFVSCVDASIFLAVGWVGGFPIRLCGRTLEHEREDEANDIGDGEGKCCVNAILPTLIERPLLEASIEEEDRAFGAAG